MCENLCDLQDYMLPLQTVKNAAIAQLVEHNLAKVGVASSSLVFRSETQRTIERLSSAFFSVLRSGRMILYLVFRGAGVSIKVCEITCRSAGSNSISFFIKRWFIIREKS